MTEPRDRLRAIAERLQAVLLAPTREDQIVAIREFDRHAIKDVAWQLQREKGLRVRLQQSLRKVAALEGRVRELEHGREKTGLRAPAMHKPSLVEEAAELRQLSKELALDQAMDDAFEDDEQEWFETQD
jgi:hypothetical protein